MLASRIGAGVCGPPSQAPGTHQRVIENLDESTELMAPPLPDCTDAFTTVSWMPQAAEGGGVAG